MLPRRIFCCCIAVVYSFAMIRSVSACTMGTLAVCLGSLVRWSSEHNSYLISYIATVRMHWYLYVRDIYLDQFCVSFHHLFHFTIIIFVFWCAALYHLKIIFSQYFFLHVFTIVYQSGESGYIMSCYLDHQPTPYKYTWERQTREDEWGGKMENGPLFV